MRSEVLATVTGLISDAATPEDLHRAEAEWLHRGLSLGRTREGEYARRVATALRNHNVDVALRS